MSNVIDFATMRKKIESQKQEIKSEEDIQLDEFVIDSALDMTYTIVEMCQLMGIDPEKADCANDLVLVVESIKGLMYRALEKSFPTQEMSRIIFEIKNPDEFIKDFFDYE